jgi:hypothetical protein
VSIRVPEEPAVKAGRDWLIKREDLDRFLEDQKNVRGDEE